MTQPPKQFWIVKETLKVLRHKPIDVSQTYEVIETSAALEQQDLLDECEKDIELLPLNKSHKVDYYDCDDDAICKPNCPACAASKLLTKLRERKDRGQK